MKRPVISVIIVNWNGKKWLKKCFDSLEKQTYRETEIILVDNNSSDGSLNLVKENYPEIKIIQNSHNLGFGKANNLGVKKAKGEVIFFLNNDTKLKKDVLEKLLSFIKEENLNLAGPKILNYQGKDLFKGRKITIDPTGYIGWGKEAFYVEGSALMISKKDFLVLGGFDKEFFMYSEDIDLSWRARLYGMKLGICQEAVIFHFMGGSSVQTYKKRGKKYVTSLLRRYEVEKNNLRMLIKNYRLITLAWVMPLFLIQTLAESTLYLISLNFGAFKAIWRAHNWNLRHLNGTLKQREIIQKKRIVGDNQILKLMSFWPNKLKSFLLLGMPKFK